MKPNYIFIPAAVLCFSIAILTSCEDPFQYNPNEVLLHDDEKNLNAKSISKIESIPHQDSLRFVVISDPHHDYENLEDFVDAANTFDQIAFVAIAGDLTTFGLQTEYREFHTILKDLNIPFVAVIGNHDLLGNGGKVFKEMFGPLNFTFTCSGNKFICMDSNSREYDFNGKVPDIGWMQQELSAQGFNNMFVLSHISPFDTDFDPSLELGFAEAISASQNARLSLHGHSHDFYQADHYDDGVLYLITDDIKDRGYALITVWDNGFRVEQKHY